MDALRFVPFSSAPKVAFWQAVAERKLRDWRLDDAPRPARGFYWAGGGARVVLDAASLRDGAAPPGATALAGRVTVVNTLEAFRRVDAVCGMLQTRVAELNAKLRAAEERKADAYGRREMGARLAEGLRAVGRHGLGSGYTVVREVLVLPEVGAALHTAHVERLAAIEAAWKAARAGGLVTCAAEDGSRPPVASSSATGAAEATAEATAEAVAAAPQTASAL